MSGTGASHAAAVAAAPEAIKPVSAATSPETQKSLEDGQISKIHSAIRWGKSEAEMEAIVSSVGASMATAVEVEDLRNGNRCLHVAAQNGHNSLVKFLIQLKADVNARNGKGQTALHMSVAYDFYFLSKQLFAAGADPTIVNGDGHQAIAGIDGDKSGVAAWDSPISVLKGASDDPEELEAAFHALENADASNLDKAELAQTGMSKKKTCKVHWNAERFMKVMRRI